MTSTFSTSKHWSHTCHETVLLSNDSRSFIPLPLAGGADNGQFIYLKQPISLLRNKSTVNIIKGNRIDADEIVLSVEQQQVSGYTLSDAQQLLETLSANGKQIKLKTVKSGM